MTYENLSFTEYKKLWLSTALEQGHKFETDSDGDIDWFVLERGFHNGPKCSICGWECCWHCTPIDKIPECSAIERKIIVPQLS